MLWLFFFTLLKLFFAGKIHISLESVAWFKLTVYLLAVHLGQDIVYVDI